MFGHPVVKAVYVGIGGEHKKPVSTICPTHMDICYEPGYCSTSSYLAFLGGALFSPWHMQPKYERLILFHFIFPMKICPNCPSRIFFFLHKLANITIECSHHPCCNLQQAKISFGLPMKHGNPGKDHYK